MNIEEALKWFAERPKPENPPIFDFCRPIGHGCKDCGYPFSGPMYKLKHIDCPEHMPPEWKYHERKAYEEAMGGKP